jgi:tetratricopeptide (TPR) repeat protein
MLSGRKRDYGRRYDATLFRPRRERPKAGVRAAKWLLVLAVVAAGVIALVGPKGVEDRLLPYLPVPKELQGVEVVQNGRAVSVPPGGTLKLNPKDTFHIETVKTDGWIPWGLEIVSVGVDFERAREAPVAVQDLWPGEAFEEPRRVPVEVFWRGHPLGSFTVVVEWDARDWLEKAAETEDPRAKIALLERVVEADPKNVLARTHLAGLYAEEGRLTEAEKIYREILETGRSRPMLEKLLEIHTRQGKVDAALGVHMELLQLTQDPKVFESLLGFLRRHKKAPEAAAFLVRQEEAIPRAFLGAYYLALADFQTEAGLWADVAKTYGKALKAGVKDPNVHYNLSVAHKMAGNLDHAVQALERYLQANPKDVNNRLRLGALLEEKKDVQGARRVYQELLKSNPGNEQALLRLIALLEKDKDKTALASAYESLVALRPEDKVAWHNLALLYYEQEKWKEAAKAFEKVAGMDPRDVPSRKYLLDLYQKAGNRKAETRVLEELVGLEPDNLGYYDTYFAVLNNSGDYKKMVAFFEKAAKERPNVAAFHQYVLLGSLKLGDKRKALVALENLVRLKPKEKKYLRQAAQLHESLKQYDEALKKTEAILKLDPGDRQAKDDYLRLRMLLLGGGRTDLGGKTVLYACKSSGVVL